MWPFFDNAGDDDEAGDDHDIDEQCDGSDYQLPFFTLMFFNTFVPNFVPFFGTNGPYQLGVRAEGSSTQPSAGDRMKVT